MGTERLIKRYTNRKLYDTLESRYVTLEEIARLVREGEDVSVVDNETSEDLTSVTFAQIILEEERRKTNLISVPFLRKLIRSGEARVQDLSDRASRGIEALGDMAEKAGKRVRGVVEGGGKAIEEGRSFVEDLLDIPQKRLEELREAAKRSVRTLRTNPTVQRELERVASSLRSLEEAVARLRDEEARGTEPERPPDAGITGHEGEERMHSNGGTAGEADDQEPASDSLSVRRESKTGT